MSTEAPGRRWWGRSAVLALALLATACTQPSNGHATASTTLPSAATGPAGGQAVVVATSGLPATLDLTTSSAPALAEVLDDNVYQHLVQLTPTGSLVDVLATSVTVSADHLTWTFGIRRGVRFSNGDPPTAADVAFSLERVVAPGSLSPEAHLLSLVRSVRTIGRQAVAVTLRAPDWGWAYALAGTPAGAVVDPRTVGVLATQTIGTGPFEVGTAVPGQSITLVRNPFYWGRQAASVAVDFRSFTTPAAENLALQSGQVDVIDNELDPRQVAQFARSSRFVVLNGPSHGKVQMTINNDSGQLADPLVRQAIAEATNKKAVVEAASAGFGTLLGAPVAPGNPAFVDLAPTVPYDPAQARRLLARAGASHLALTLTLPPAEYAQVSGPLLAADLRAVGIHVTVAQLSWPAWFTQVFGRGDYQLTVVSQAAAQGLNDYANPQYYFHYRGAARMAKLLARAAAAPTRAGWVAGEQQAARLLASQAVNDWLYDLPSLTIAQKGIVGLPTTALSDSFQAAYLSRGGNVPASALAQGFTSAFTA